MPHRLNVFTKVLILLVLLLIPILILYSYSNRITHNVIQGQIQSSNLNQLSFFLHQLDSNIDQMSMFPVILSYDPYIREFLDKSGSPGFDALKAQSRITEKLSLQSVSSEWNNDLTIAMPHEKRMLSSSIFLNGSDLLSGQDAIRNTWTYIENKKAGTGGSFLREIGEPAYAKAASQARAVFQVRFSTQNMVDMLDVYKRDKKSEPFLFHPQYGPILNSTASAGPIQTVVRELKKDALADSGQKTIQLNGEPYLVSYVKSAKLGWYLADYVPLQNILTPITKTRNLFYFTVGLLLVMSVLAAFLLYRNVQIPILKLIRSLQRMKRGDLSVRIEYKARNEFDFLFQRFNEMAERIQVLVEDVYAEKIRSREATLKQLQSQINPHFLYNSLFFIINSAELEDREAVVAMAQNLADFYRYTTRVENQNVALREELEMVRHYLTIQNLRMHRLEYDIDVPDEMLEEKVPRLILQPLVENAVIHGIERKRGGGRITITGVQDEEHNRIIVEDNGTGLDEEGLRRLAEQINAPMNGEIGCGTWNVHHRLYYRFGEGSGLTFARTPDGGLRVVLAWNRSLPPESGNEGG